MRKVIVITLLFYRVIIHAQIDFQTLSQNFVLNRLKSPYTCTFVDFLSNTETKELLNRNLFNLKECTDATRVTVNAQNSFGAYIRSDYFVFFKDCKPCTMIESQELQSRDMGKRALYLGLALASTQCICETTCSSVNNNSQINSINKKTIEEPIASEVKIGEQIWTTKNLNTDKFRNGDKILFATNMGEWKKFGESSTPAWCYYDFNELNGTKFGKLYNYFAVVDPRGIADEGWHIPSNEEWTQLEDYIGNNFTSYGRPVGKENAGRQMKVSGFGNDPVGEGTYNWSKFYGTPGGWLENGSFKNMNHNGYWWGSTELAMGNGYTGVKCRHLSDDGYIGNYLHDLWTDQNSGISIRLVKGEIKQKNENVESSGSGQVIIGNQIWMKNNLYVDTFRNGDKILESKNWVEWENANKTKTPTFIKSGKPNKYGFLYNWYAVTDPRGLAPVGWHIPSINDWKVLSNSIGGDYESGSKLRIDNGNWRDIQSPQNENQSGFNAYPSGYMPTTSWPVQHIGAYTGWWSTDEASINDVFDAGGYMTGFKVGEGILKSKIVSVANGSPKISFLDKDKKEGYSVRCIIGNLEIPKYKDYSQYPSECMNLMMYYKIGKFTHKDKYESDLLTYWGNYANKWSFNNKNNLPQISWTSDMLNEMREDIKKKLLLKECKFNREYRKVVFEEVNNPFYIEGFSK
jgi:uncharacterized protein (TIGR02145 family)